MILVVIGRVLPPNGFRISQTNLPIHPLNGMPPKVLYFIILLGSKLSSVIHTTFNWRWHFIEGGISKYNMANISIHNLTYKYFQCYQNQLHHSSLLLELFAYRVQKQTFAETCKVQVRTCSSTLIN
jgi:hypothetical protein